MTVFLSYSSKDTKYASELDNIFMKYGVNMIRDDRDLQPLENVRTFMQSIQKNDFAVMLISEKYLRSKNCLYEFSEFMTVPNFWKRIIPIMLPEFKLGNSFYQSLMTEIKAQNPEQKTSISFPQYIKNLFVKNKAKKEAVNQFQQVWKYISETKLFNYQQSKTHGFKDIFSFLGIYEEDIYNQLKKIKKKMNDGEELDIALAKLLNNHPGSFAIWYHRCTLYEEKAQYKKAIFYYEEYLKKFKETSEQIFGFYGLGVCYNHMKEFEKAIDAHSKAISLDPQHWWKSYAGLGDIYINQNQSDKAFEYFLKANNIVKEFKVSQALASIEYNRKNYLNATKFYKEAIELNSNEAELYFLLKESLINSGQIIEAEKVTVEAYNKFPEAYKIITDYVSLRMSKNDKIEEVPSYIKLLQKSHNINPDYPKTKMLIASLLFSFRERLSNWTIAIDTLEDTLKLPLSEDETKWCVSKLYEMYKVTGDNNSINKLKSRYKV